MSKFNNIDYHNYNDFEENSAPIYRKLRIIDNSNNNANESERIEDNISIDENEENNNVDNSASFRTINLNSTMPYGYNKKQNRYYDSLTNTSFNDINDFNELNNIKFSGKKESLIMEVEDTKNILRNNIQKVYERENLISELDEKSKNLLDGSEKFRNTSKYLKRKMYFNYVCHIASLVMTILIIITFIIILSK